MWPNFIYFRANFNSKMVPLCRGVLLHPVVLCFCDKTEAYHFTKTKIYQLQKWQHMRQSQWCSSVLLLLRLWSAGDDGGLSAHVLADVLELSAPGESLQPEVQLQALRLREPVAGVGRGQQHVHVVLVLIFRPGEVLVAPLQRVEDTFSADVSWLPLQEPADQTGQSWHTGRCEAVLVIWIKFHVRRDPAGVNLGFIQFFSSSFQFQLQFLVFRLGWFQVSFHSLQLQFQTGHSAV